MTGRLYGLEVCYNDNKPLYCFSSKPAGVGAQLYTGGAGSLDLIIYHKVGDERVRYQLNPVLPGDKLSFRYLDGGENVQSTINQLEALSRAGGSSALQPGLRIGLDAKLKSGKAVRVSHPDLGGFQFILGNVPLDHARVQFMAGNQVEEWYWQFPDLYPNEAITLEVVETNWNDPPPTVEQKDKKGERGQPERSDFSEHRITQSLRECRSEKFSCRWNINQKSPRNRDFSVSAGGNLPGPHPLPD
jgi:hypothetical protein